MAYILQLGSLVYNLYLNKVFNNKQLESRRSYFLLNKLLKIKGLSVIKINVIIIWRRYLPFPPQFSQQCRAEFSAGSVLYDTASYWHWYFPLKQCDNIIQSLEKWSFSLIWHFYFKIIYPKNQRYAVYQDLSASIFIIILFNTTNCKSNANVHP